MRNQDRLQIARKRDWVNAQEKLKTTQTVLYALFMNVNRSGNMATLNRLIMNGKDPDVSESGVAHDHLMNTDEEFLRASGIPSTSSHPTYNTNHPAMSYTTITSTNNVQDNKLDFSATSYSTST
ncbi:hypothetical protein BDD12DRAFT_876104 [Trichophaea hybrida]|nr:hypothetical protein BDD12DRAFT_876104 [Trichophaea hybrida]